MKTATDKLIGQKFKVSNFSLAMKHIQKENDAFFQETFFTDKATFITKLNTLNKEINTLADTYAMALEASKSGSVIENFAGMAIGQVKKEYSSKRKLLVNYLSFFMTKKVQRKK